mmetsp:Transcript_53745/g.135737  ORF Transcript_53745/g.135737 Transcript_53745/m.135737 type:complete len:571 (+) Transcript_53745:267-1979(+)
MAQAHSPRIFAYGPQAVQDLRSHLMPVPTDTPIYRPAGMPSASCSVGMAGPILTRATFSPGAATPRVNGGHGQVLMQQTPQFGHSDIGRIGTQRHNTANAERPAVSSVMASEGASNYLHGSKALVRSRTGSFQHGCRPQIQRPIYTRSRTCPVVVSSKPVPAGPVLMRLDTSECDHVPAGPVLTRMDSGSSEDDNSEMLSESGCFEIPSEFKAQLAEMGFSEDDCQEMYHSIREQVDDSMKAEMRGYIARVGHHDATIQGFWDDRVNLGADRAGRTNPFDAPSPTPVQGLWKFAFYVAWKEVGGQVASMPECAEDELLTPQSSSSSSSSSDTDSSDGEEEEEEEGDKLNETSCPEGIAEDVWAELPLGLRQDLLSEGLVLSPEQEENAVFVESLDPSLRAEVLRTAEEAFLAALPPHLALEAHNMRSTGPAARKAGTEDTRTQVTESIATSARRLVNSASGAMGRVARSAAEQLPTRGPRQPVAAAVECASGVTGGLQDMAIPSQRGPQQPVTMAAGSVSMMTGRLHCAATGAQQRLARMAWRRSDGPTAVPEGSHNDAVTLLHVSGRSD